MTPAPDYAALADELERLGAGATPGEWAAADWQDDFGDDKSTIETSRPEVLSPGQSSIWPGGIVKVRVASTEDGNNPLEDAALIVALANARPALVDALREVGRMREALEPFSAHADFWAAAVNSQPVFTSLRPRADGDRNWTGNLTITVGDLRRARAALAGEPSHD